MLIRVNSSRTERAKKSIKSERIKGRVLYHLVRVDTGQKLKKFYYFLDDLVENDKGIVVAMH